MSLDIVTLIIVLSIILTTQVVALFIQYKVNKTYKGIGYWLVGFSFITLGLISLPMVTVKSIEKIARIGNPLIILGHIFLYIGIKKFLNTKVNNWIPTSIFAFFNLFYYYYMYIDNNLIARTFIINISIAIISFMMAYQLFFKKNKLLSHSTNFTAAVIFFNGCFHIARIISTSILPPMKSYTDKGSTLIIAIIFYIIFTNLLTLALILMVNNRLNIEIQLEKENLQLIFNTSIDAQIITRLEDGMIIDVNDEFDRLSGYSRTDIIGTSVKKNIFWYKYSDRRIFTKELKDKGFCHNLEFTFQRKDNIQFTGMISARIIDIQSVPHIISVVRDITQRKNDENALIESEEKYRSILNASPDDITITDLDGHIIMISPAANEMFGYEPDFDNFIGMKLLDFIIPEDVERAKSNIIKMYQDMDRSSNEYCGVRKDGSIFDIEVNSGFVYNVSGIPDKMVFIVRDITKRKIIEAEVQKLVKELEVERNIAELLSITDGLTGLYNRRYFDNTLSIEFARLSRSETMLSLIMVDIDHFKKYNDSYGHLAGDKCLQMVSTLLKNSVSRASDIVARYGGEEFIIILPDTCANGAEVLGERIRKGIEELAIPHIASNTSKYLTVSVGVLTVSHSNKISLDQALKLVDDALYLAKEQGRNRCVTAEI